MEDAGGRRDVCSCFPFPRFPDSLGSSATFVCPCISLDSLARLTSHVLIVFFRPDRFVVCILYPVPPYRHRCERNGFGGLALCGWYLIRAHWALRDVDIMVAPNRHPGSDPRFPEPDLPPPPSSRGKVTSGPVTATVYDIQLATSPFLRPDLSFGALSAPFSGQEYGACPSKGLLSVQGTRRSQDLWAGMVKADTLVKGPRFFSGESEINSFG